MRYLKPVHLYAFGWVILVAGMVWYVNFAQAQTVNCLYEAQAKDSAVTALRSDAAGRRDDALVRSKETMARIVQLRVRDQVADSAEIQRLSAQYIDATAAYVRAQHDLDRVRDKNPPPDIRKMCR